MVSSKSSDVYLYIIIIYYCLFAISILFTVTFRVAPIHYFADTTDAPIFHLQNWPFSDPIRYYCLIACTCIMNIVINYN